MILAFFIALFVGVFQVVFDILFYAAVFAGKIAKGIVSVLVKILLYCGLLWLTFKLFKLYVAGVAVGFAIGFFPLLVIYCIRKLKSK